MGAIMLAPAIAKPKTKPANPQQARVTRNAAVTSWDFSPAMTNQLSRMPVADPAFVAARKVCPCGGGCPRCAAKARRAGAGHQHDAEQATRERSEHAALQRLQVPIQKKLRVGAVHDSLEHE